MKRHFYSDDYITDGYCGPDQGPNCPACRTLKTEKMDQLNKVGKFQGSSGMIYWGKSMEKTEERSDGICGPNKGYPWEDCLNEILKKEKEI